MVMSMLFNNRGVWKTIGDTPRDTVEQILCKAMIDNVIDESLRADNYRNGNIGSTPETVLQARKDILSPWFESVYMSTYGMEADAVIDMLEDLWEHADPVEMERVRRNYACQSQRWQQAMAEGQRKRSMEECYEV
jgi:hypothetical protein